MAGYEYPPWGEALGFLISTSSMIWVPGRDTGHGVACNISIPSSRLHDLLLLLHAGHLARGAEEGSHPRHRAQARGRQVQGAAGDQEPRRGRGEAAAAHRGQGGGRGRGREVGPGLGRENPAAVGVRGGCQDGGRGRGCLEQAAVTRASQDHASGEQ